LKKRFETVRLKLRSKKQVVHDKALKEDENKNKLPAKHRLICKTPLFSHFKERINQ